MIESFWEQFDPAAHTILAIDDMPANLKVVVGFLREFGFRVLTARSGASGLAHAERGKPDLILLDVLMPGMDGFETCRRLKANEQTRNIPVIFMTALSGEGNKVKGFNVGGVDYVTKPIQQQEVLARIKTHLSIRDLTFGLKKLVEARTAELEQSLLREQHLSQQLEHSLAKETVLSQLKSQIIEIISHEFRTPLTVISQSAQFLNNFFDKMSLEKRTHYLEVITESTFDIDRLIKEVFLVHQITAGEVEVKLTAVSPKSFCEQFRASLPSESDGATRLTISCHPGVGEAFTDMNLVTQIVSRLVENGLLFSEDEVKVTASWDQAEVSITVIDSGIGIPLSDQEKIFDLFYRAENVDARRGLGVGLYIAHSLAQLLGAAISVTNVDNNQGSTFALTIPFTSKQ